MAKPSEIYFSFGRDHGPEKISNFLRENKFRVIAFRSPEIGERFIARGGAFPETMVRLSYEEFTERLIVEKDVCTKTGS